MTGLGSLKNNSCPRISSIECPKTKKNLFLLSKIYIFIKFSNQSRIYFVEINNENRNHFYKIDRVLGQQLIHDHVTRTMSSKIFPMKSVNLLVQLDLRFAPCRTIENNFEHDDLFEHHTAE